MQNRRGISLVSLIGIVAAVLVLGAVGFTLRAKTPALSTPYQAVLLSNGSVYFGRLQGLGTAYPVLMDVYYVQNNVNPETKEVSNILVKRGKEWHAPDRMVLNAQNIIFIEPVSQDSKVAQLIAESKH